MVGGVAGEDVGEARLDADPNQGEQAGLAPALVFCELRVAELHARLREYGSSGCGSESVIARSR